MQTDATDPTPRERALLDAAITQVTRSRRMYPEDAADFRQTVHLRLAERDGDIFTRFTGRSSLRTYLLVVMHRMLLDWQNHTFGKWRPSAAAHRLGPVAVTLERLIDRDGFGVESAIEHIRASQPHLEAARLRRMAEALPIRRRRQLVMSELSPMTQTVGFDDPLDAAQRRHQDATCRAALAGALAQLGREDRRLVWLRYRQRRTVPEVAREFRTDPKPLYRRFDRILLELRERLVAQGVTQAPVSIE